MTAAELRSQLEGEDGDCRILVLDREGRVFTVKEVRFEHMDGKIILELGSELEPGE